MDITEKSKLVNKEKKITRELIKLLHEINRFRKRYADLQTVVNWLFALAAATLLWIFNSIDKFMIHNALPFKWLYIIVILTIGTSVISFGVARFLLLMYVLFTRTVVKDVEYFPSQVLLFYDSKQEIIDKRKKSFEEAVEIMLEADSWVSYSFKITYLTIIVFVAGLALLTAYVVLFLLKCV